MCEDLNVMSYYFAKIPKKKKTKLAHDNTTAQKFRCMEEYFNGVKANLTYSNYPVCNDESSKIVG